MADIILLLEVFDRLVAADLRRSRVYRDRTNPFDISDVNFIAEYRLSKPAAMYIIERLRPFIESTSEVRTALTPELKVLCTLNYFAAGGYQKTVASNENLQMSQASVSRCIKEVTLQICEKLMPEWVQYNINHNSLTGIKAGFQRKFNFPGVIGCIDCTHVKIIQPSETEEAPPFVYINRHGNYTINVQLICDSDMKILNVIAKYPGSNHDAYIWKHSDIRRALSHRAEEGSWLLGDSGYPLEPWLMTPINNPNTQSQQSYNRRHIATRNIIERVNGLLKSRFRCLLQERSMHYAPETVGQIINACCVLHNICRHYNVANPPIVPDPDADDAWGPMMPTVVDGRLRRAAERIRNNLILTRF